jgi:hypothetical protein
MRNRITATADRPIPLPDRLLADGWWLVEPPRRPTETMRLKIIASQEGARDRHNSEGWNSTSTPGA